MNDIRKFQKFLIDYEKHWIAVLPQNKATEMLKVSKVLRERIKANHNSLIGVTINWPEDFDTEDSFWFFWGEFSKIVDVYSTSTGYKMVFI